MSCKPKQQNEYQTKLVWKEIPDKDQVKYRFNRLVYVNDF